MSQIEQVSPDRNGHLVRARGLGVRRDGQWLIRGIDIEVQRGEIVTLIGPNGSGKTTTVRALLGIVDADEGEAARAPNVQIGYVPQKLDIDRTLPLSVARFMTLTRSHADADIDEALNAVGAGTLAKSAIQSLSGGEFQRILLARALIQKPDLLVLDEPVQNVDFSGGIALYGLIRDIRDRTGCGILLISHDLHIVMAETDRVVCLNQHVCCSGTPHSVAADPAYRELFGGKAAEAIAIYRHDHDHTHGPDGSVMPIEGGGHGEEPADHA